MIQFLKNYIQIKNNLKIRKFNARRLRLRLRLKYKKFYQQFNIKTHVRINNDKTHKDMEVDKKVEIIHK